MTDLTQLIAQVITVKPHDFRSVKFWHKGCKGEKSMKKRTNQGTPYEPHLRVKATGEICEFAGFDEATQIFDVKSADGKMRRLPRSQIEFVPPHEAPAVLRRRRQRCDS